MKLSQNRLALDIRVPARRINEIVHGKRRVTPDTQTAISYEYDPLYRLVEAVYTGTITATYSYAYDAVGNMAAFTETIAGQTAAVTRDFDGANRLESSYDGTITTTYGYDGDGNLIDDGTRRYGYDQRNLLITSTIYVSGTGYVPLADYVYDGAGNRLQQVDYSGATTKTITYTNDILGLAQVLVADDGTDQTRYLVGLDLITEMTALRLFTC